MRLLALETSHRTWQIALLQDERIVATSPASDRSLARFLQVEIDTALRAAGWRPADLQGIAVDLGPGAFTSLRVGLTAAKSLAYALAIPLVGLHSLELLALAAVGQTALPTGSVIVSLVDAQRGEFVQQPFRKVAEDTVEPLAAARLIAYDELRAAADSNANWTLAAPDTLPRRTASGATPLPRLWPCRLDAVVLGNIAARRFALLPQLDPLRALPEYFRPSYADEKNPPAA